MVKVCCSYDQNAYHPPSQAPDVEEGEAELEAIPESPKTDTPSLQVKLISVTFFFPKKRKQLKAHVVFISSFT